jgi:hypothetical protein
MFNIQKCGRVSASILRVFKHKFYYTIVVIVQFTICVRKFAWLLKCAENRDKNKSNFNYFQSGVYYK